MSAMRKMRGFVSGAVVAGGFLEVCGDAAELLALAEAAPDQ
jgi:hypothetical protein